MIVKGGSRRNVAFFARHLLRTDHNDRVSLVEIRDLAASDVRGALREMAAIASGTRVKNFLYHASLNPRDDEQLTAEQWHQATDILERHLGLTGQPRVVVEHAKEGRTHRHVIWNRIEADSLRAVSDALTYRKHEQAAREIEQRLAHAPVASVLVKDRSTPRPPRRPRDRESFRGAESGRSPQAITAEITALWNAASSGQAFATALAQRGYILARGDRRDFCIVDAAGDDHSLARRIAGVKAAAIRARMAAIDRDALPSVAQARAMARQGTAGGSESRPTAPVARVLPIRSDPAAREIAQMRAATAQLTRQLWRAQARPAMRRITLPRFEPATGPAMAREQMRAAAQPFADAIRTLGYVPELVSELAVTGMGWIARATRYLAELAEDLRSTVRDVLTRPVHGARGALDPGPRAP